MVIYLGKNGNHIRSDAQLAVCEMLDGTFDPATGCAGASGARFTALISESLGSTILFDAFRSLRLDYLAARKTAVDRLMANAPKLQRDHSSLKGAAKPSPAISTYKANVATANQRWEGADEFGQHLSRNGFADEFLHAGKPAPLLNFADPQTAPSKNSSPAP